MAEFPTHLERLYYDARRGNVWSSEWFVLVMFVMYNFIFWRHIRDVKRKCICCWLNRLCFLSVCTRGKWVSVDICMCTVCVIMWQRNDTEELCLLWCKSWLHRRTVRPVLKVPAINPQTLVLSRWAHFIPVRDVSSVLYSKGTAGASSSWQRRSQSLRHSSGSVQVQHIRGNWTSGRHSGSPPSCLHRSAFGGLNWKRENDVQERYTVVKHNDPGCHPSPQPFLSYITLLSFPPFTVLYSSAVVFSSQIFAQHPYPFLSLLTVFLSLCVLTEQLTLEKEMLHNQRVFIQARHALHVISISRYPYPGIHWRPQTTR